MGWGFLDYVPGVSNVKGAIEGDWGQAVLGPTWQGGQDIYAGGKKLVNKISDAYNAPYEEKAKGLDAIRAETERIKQERLARKRSVYNEANSKFDDTRRAMSAVYGDPSKWSL